MQQVTFTETEYAGKRRQIRRELFLIEVDQVVPWKGLFTQVEWRKRCMKPPSCGSSPA